MKKIKSQFLMAIMAMSVAVIGTNEVPAVPINGTIGFTGGVQLDTSSADTATEVTGYTSSVVTARGGDFSSVALNSAVAFATPWSFNSGPLNAFWSVGGFTFNLLASSITYQANGFVDVTGSGSIVGNGFDPTFGTYTFSTSNPGSGNPTTFTFQSASGANGVSVSDEGNTSLMLGASLSGVACLGLIRRKQTA
jgi:hypothetical protein